MTRFAVVVAVEDAALLTRAVPALLAQTVRPDHVVVVTGSENQALVLLRERFGDRLSVVEVQASRFSAFNRGAARLLALGVEPGSCQVAFVGDEEALQAVDYLESAIAGLPSIPLARLDHLLLAGLFDEDGSAPCLARRLESVGAPPIVEVSDTPRPDPGPGEASDGRSAPEASEIRLQHLQVGVISGEPESLALLLADLTELGQQPCVTRLSILVLQNGAAEHELMRLVIKARSAGVRCELVNERRQAADADAGLFGPARQRPPGQVGIGQARTMLQRYLGQWMEADPGSVGWVLDDDMRVDGRARQYLPWLPAFRTAGVDVLLGAYEGSSPNPPLNGLRVQLVDVWNNLTWLGSLASDLPLPDRGRHNEMLRRRYPDYYYDLSRKHSAHLEAPFWLCPDRAGETVGEARERLAGAVLGLLNGAPLTRPLLAPVPTDPLLAARPSVNRGGCTFILNPSALTDTPNLVMTVDGREARRSDMIWAITNRYFHGMETQRVNFPVVHTGRVRGEPRFDRDKVVGEIIGSAFYGAFTGFLAGRTRHDFRFSGADLSSIGAGVEEHFERRLGELRVSFYRIQGLARALGPYQEHGRVEQLVAILDEWFTKDSFARLEAGVRAATRSDVKAFLSSMRPAVEAYRRASAGRVDDGSGTP